MARRTLTKSRKLRNVQSTPNVQKQTVTHKHSVQSTASLEDLFDSVDQRNQLAEHYEVLEKVKQLLLIPNTNYATTALVANFYEVDSEAIKKIIQRHSDELSEDGMKMLTGPETKALLVRDIMSPTNFRGYFEYEGIRFANKMNILFTRRAILRIGMLLRDSQVAKEVRTQLLNIEEKTSNETKISDITEEQSLMLAVGMAYASGNIDAMLKATTEYNAFQNRHIQQLEDTIQQNQPLVDFATTVSLTEDTLSLGQFAKIINKDFPNMGRNRLYKWLRDNKLLCKDNTPYQQYITQGYFTTKEVLKKDNYGQYHVFPMVLVTGKGQQYIYNKMKNKY